MNLKKFWKENKILIAALLLMFFMILISKDIPIGLT